MKILWITNVLFPDICKFLTIDPPVTGGWMKSLAENLIKNHPDVELYVAALYGENKPTIKQQINNITYYCLPFNPSEPKYYKSQETFWKRIKEDCKPDVVHIHGTEYPHGLAYINANGASNVVISIQGLTHIISQYCLGGISTKILKKYRTLYDYLKSPILKLPQKMIKQGSYEIKYLKQSSNFIGRTDWDRVHIKAINPQSNYYFCNEILRSEFYNENTKWDISNCKKHTIFLSQAYSPIKGIHKLIEALPLIIREFPDTKVYVAGNNFLDDTSIINKLKLSTYANYIKHLITQYNVSNHIIFLGKLSAKDMSKQYQNAHVFVCPSIIENSPNSVGEAQLIGTPCVASYVGGVPNMIIHGKTGLIYRFEEYEMLAECVCSIFRNSSLANNLSFNSRKAAEERHDPKTNSDITYNIYRSIIQL